MLLFWASTKKNHTKRVHGAPLYKRPTRKRLPALAEWGLRYHKHRLDGAATSVWVSILVQLMPNLWIESVVIALEAGCV